MKISNLYQTAKSALARNKQAMTQADQRAARLAAGALVGAMILAPGMAMAAPWDSTANQVLSMLTGTLATSIATIAFVAAGIAGLAGKLSWDWVIKILIGIVLIFGAPQIVAMFSAAARG